MASRYWHKNIVTRRSSMVDPYVRMAAAVLVQAAQALKKSNAFLCKHEGVDYDKASLKMQRAIKGAEASKESAEQFLLSTDSPWHQYLELNGHVLPVDKAIDLALPAEDE